MFSFQCDSERCTKMTQSSVKLQTNIYESKKLLMLAVGHITQTVFAFEFCFDHQA